MSMIEKRASIFRCGDYPAKGWSCTAAEFIAANGATGTIPIGLDPVRRDHYIGEDSVLDGETGTATFSVEGDEVFATLTYPDWLDRARAAHDLKVSAVFPSRSSKAIGKVDLVAKPHIKDAVIFADGQHGVLVTEDDEPVAFAGRRAGYAQMVHDMAAGHSPSFCKPKGVGFAEAGKADRLVRLMHDHAVSEGGATCSGMKKSGHYKEFGMSDETESVEVEPAPVPDEAVAFATEETPREKEMRLRMERLESQLIEKDAVAFADSVTRGDNRRAEPAERPYILDQYRQAAKDDARLADAVTFSDGGKPVTGSRVDALKAGFKVRPRINHRSPQEVAKDVDLDAEPPAVFSENEDAELKKIYESAASWASTRNGTGKK